MTQQLQSDVDMREEAELRAGEGRHPTPWAQALPAEDDGYAGEGGAEAAAEAAPAGLGQPRGDHRCTRFV